MTEFTGSTFQVVYGTLTVNPANVKCVYSVYRVSCNEIYTNIITNNITIIIIIIIIATTTIIIYTNITP